MEMPLRCQSDSRLAGAAKVSDEEDGKTIHASVDNFTQLSPKECGNANEKPMGKLTFGKILYSYFQSNPLTKKALAGPRIGFETTCPSRDSHSDIIHT